MSATVPVYVTVLKTHTEVTRISAITKGDAVDEARALPGVVAVIDATYEEPGEYRVETGPVVITARRAERLDDERLNH